MWRGLLLLICIAGCGYRVGAPAPPGGVRLVRVAPVIEMGADVDQGAAVGAAVRAAWARSSGLRLAGSGSKKGVGTLQIRVKHAGSALEPFTSPSLRATQSKFSVRIEAELRDSQGTIVWRSGAIQGTSSFLTAPGGAEALDGVRRTALVRAADDAAQALINKLLYGPRPRDGKDVR